MKYGISTERVDLFDVNIVIVMQVKLREAVPFEELQKAFEKACSAHEVLRSKVVIDEEGEAFYVDCDCPKNSFSETTQTLTELINSNERKRFKIEEGEFIRGFAAPDGLVFMMHHLGGDGKSLLYFIETFMNCLSGNEIGEVPFKNLTLENLPENSRIPFFYKILVNRWNRKWQKDKRVFDFLDMDRAYKNFWENRKTKTIIKRYEKSDIEQLIQKAKRAGVSLTAYLITDMIKDEKKKVDVGLAVDGRTDNNRSMGNQATGISVEYKYDEKKSFEENAMAIHSLMQKKLNDDRYRFFVLGFMGKLDSTLKDALNLEHAGYFHAKSSSTVAELLGYGEKVKDYSITNLTRADIPLKYGDYEIKEIAFIPPVISYGKNIIGIVTAGDVMNIAWHTYEE
ncbi:hypothetical protein [Butyrivibrio sp. VCD2006]|uniref:hypothetical protein n=1 Tax=Butyrivibrio sp. VCD2006 TaxID=1280664 RepID=UPI00040DC583|nr:hypothetical protein [Butyrivibrio sp. VCD2006]